jgi:hypothetical protein
MEKPLVERLHEYVAGDALRLPVFSEIALRLQRLAREEHWEMREVEAAIQSDQVLVAEVLRAANSAFFGGLSPIQSIRGAVVRLGLPQVARLVLLVSEASKYDLLDRELRALAHELWRHAAAVAMAAGWLARRLNYGTHEEDAFIGGLLHDVGKLAILAGLDEIGRKERLPLSGELRRTPRSACASSRTGASPTCTGASCAITTPRRSTPETSRSASSASRTRPPARSGSTSTPSRRWCSPPRRRLTRSGRARCCSPSWRSRSRTRRRS